MKILFFSGGMDRSGGTEHALSLIANSLADRGYEIIVVSMTGGDNFYYPLSPEIKAYTLGAKSFTGNIAGTLRKLKKIVKNEQPDIWVDVDIILCFYSLIVRGIRHRFKLISWEHFNHNSVFDHNAGLRRFAKKIVASQSDAFIVLSKDDEAYYGSEYRIKHRLVQIYNPVPFENTQEKKHVEKTVFAAGKLIPLKGFDTLVEAWSLLEQKYPEWQLEIAGDGPEKERLCAMIAEKKLKNVLLAGRLDDIRRHYEKAEIFVLPSKSEGLPTVVLEAMAYSLPVVAFKEKMCIGEMIGEDDEAGIIVPGRSPEALAQALEELMANDEKRHLAGKKAHERTVLFSKESVIEKWEALLKSL